MVKDEATRKKLLARLKRAEGQVAAVRRMVEEDRYCMDIMVQISAVQGALNKTGKLLLNAHIEHCVKEAFAEGDEIEKQEKIEELMEIFDRYASPGVR